MKREEMKNTYWRYYRMLEDSFIDTISYVEIDERNYKTFSNKYALLIQSIGAELDGIFKTYCGFELYERKNISDYSNYILQSYPDITSQIVIARGIEIIPFARWNADSPAQSIPWWQKFDDIKHGRALNMSDANLENTLQILAALYLLEMKMFKDIANADENRAGQIPDVPTDSSKLFTLKDWHEKWQMISEYEAIVDE